MEPRQHMSVRLTGNALDWLAQIAIEHNVHRSDVVRAALAVARKHEAELVKTVATMKERF